MDFQEDVDEVMNYFMYVPSSFMSNAQIRDVISKFGSHISLLKLKKRMKSVYPMIDINARLSDRNGTRGVLGVAPIEL